jgi:uncharacterized membrane protein HdeD (DUF308 family)
MPLSALLAIGAGIVLLARPIQGTLTLTIVVGVCFIAEGLIASAFIILGKPKGRIDRVHSNLQM